MNDISVYLGRQRGGGITDRKDAFFVFNQERYTFRLVNVRNSSTWGRNYKIRPKLWMFLCLQDCDLPVMSPLAALPIRPAVIV